MFRARSVSLSPAFLPPIMSENTLFLNCTVRDLDGVPFPGMRVSMVSSVEPANVFEGYTNSDGQVWQWYRTTGPMGQRPYWIPGTDRSLWRVLFNEYRHYGLLRSVPSVYVNLVLSDCSDRSLTLVFAEYSYAAYNGSMAMVAWGPLTNSAQAPGSPVLLGRRNSSSPEFEAESDISSFSLDSEGQPLLVRASHPTPPVSEAGEICDYENSTNDSNMGSEDSEEGMAPPSPGRKRRHSEGSDAEEGLPAKRCHTV
ncbi:hypothetical protein F5883DRAFT_577013 [Diaporthe sp. PMI_573]|nr:hypothetical protein F5883DRAFT_577013 [Diaporthaceae sp. PMI_573]